MNNLSVIVVFYDRLEELADCLDSLCSTECEVLVVDVSPTSSARVLVSGEARYIQAAENRGYGWACNLGAGLSTGASLVISNSDVVFAQNSLRGLLDVSSSQRSIVAPVQYDAGFVSAGVDSLLPLPGVKASLSRWAWIGRRRQEALRSRSLATMLARGGVHPVGGLFGLSGACLAMSREVSDGLGGFDEEFFLYEEDVDLSLRAAANGVKLLLNSESAIAHESGTNSRGVNPSTLLTSINSEAILWRKHNLGRQEILWLVQRAGLALRAAGSLLQGRWRDGQSYLTALSGRRP